MRRFTPRSLDVAAVLLVALLVLLSCTAARTPSALPLLAAALPEGTLPTGTAAALLPLEPAAATPAVTPTPGPPRLPPGAVPATDDDAAKGCASAADQASFIDAQGTYCFAYPAELSVTGADDRAVSLMGPPLEANAESLFVSLGIEVTEAPGQSLEAAVDAALAEFDGFTAWEITRVPATLGGEPALRVEPVPGQLSSRVLFVLRDGRLYRLNFWPAGPGAAAQALEALYSTVTGSFHFLQSPTAPAP